MFLEKSKKITIVYALGGDIVLQVPGFAVLVHQSKQTTLFMGSLAFTWRLLD